MPHMLTLCVCVCVSCVCVCVLDNEVNDPEHDLVSGVQDSQGDGTVPLMSLGTPPPTHTDAVIWCRSNDLTLLCCGGCILRVHVCGGVEAGGLSLQSGRHQGAHARVPAPAVVRVLRHPVPTGTLALCVCVWRPLLGTNTHSRRARSGGPATADHVDIMGNYEMTIDILRLVSNQANKYAVTVLAGGLWSHLSSFLQYQRFKGRGEDRVAHQGLRSRCGPSLGRRQQARRGEQVVKAVDLA